MYSFYFYDYSKWIIIANNHHNNKTIRLKRMQQCDRAKCKQQQQPKAHTQAYARAMLLLNISFEVGWMLVGAWERESGTYSKNSILGNWYTSHELSYCLFSVLLDFSGSNKTFIYISCIQVFELYRFKHANPYDFDCNRLKYQILILKKKTEKKIITTVLLKLDKVIWFFKWN